MKVSVGTLVLIALTSHRNEFKVPSCLWNWSTYVSLFLAFFICGSTVAAPTTLGPPHASTTNIPVGQAAPVTFHIWIPDPSYIPGSALLQEISLTGAVISTLGKLADAGENGDLVPNDLVYSIRLPIQISRPGNSFYRISAAFKGTLFRTTSDLVTVTASEGVVLPEAAAVITTDSLSFIDLAGKEISRIPIKSTSIENASGIKTDLTHFAYKSANGGCVAVFSVESQTDMRVASGSDSDEFDTQSFSAVRQYCRGDLQWERIAKPGTSFVFEQRDSPLSQNGEYVALATVADTEDESALIEVIGPTGLILFSRRGDLDTISEIRIDGRGQFVFARGIRPSGGQAAIFYDLSRQLFYSVTLDYNLYNSLRVVENPSGGFSLRGDGATLFQVP